jgi:hypothetical protein
VLLLAFPPDGSWTVGPFGNGSASRSVELAPSTQISRGFHDARMTRLRRGPFGERDPFGEAQ